MESSCHYLTDKYGYKYSVTVSAEDYVVFDSTPPLSFDIKAHGLRIVKNKNRENLPVFTDYDTFFTIKDNVLYFTAISARLRRFPRPTALFGTVPHRLGDGKYSIYEFSVPMTDYSGILSIGKDFDLSSWPKNEYTHDVPFCPEVYKQNGYIKIENGKVIEFNILN